MGFLSCVHFLEQFLLMCWVSKFKDDLKVIPQLRILDPESSIVKSSGKEFDLSQIKVQDLYCFWG